MIVVGSTMAAFVTDREDTSLAWLYNAEVLRDSVDDEVRFFAALELDARGLAPFAKVIARLQELGGTWWTYELDDGRESVTTGNRLGHICAGRNMITDYACANGASHILFLDADMAPDPATLPKLLEMRHPLVGGEVPTYDLHGPLVTGHHNHIAPHPYRHGLPQLCKHLGLTSAYDSVDVIDEIGFSYPVEEHWNTAGYLLVARNVFRFIRWRWDRDADMTDDPCYAWDALHYLGVPTFVRKDCVGTHHPEAIPPIEHRGHDMTVVRRR